MQRALLIAKAENAPAAIGLVQVPQLHRTTIHYTHGFGEMEALSDRESARQCLMLMPRA